MSDVISKHHPKFKRNPTLKKFGIKNPTAFNVELLVEEALAAEGGYKRTDSSHSDFSDLSDSKTSSISINPVTKSKNLYKGAIRAVRSSYGQCKEGALRCTIYNPHTNKLMYYYLPKDCWSSMTISRYSDHQGGNITFTYNSKKDIIPKFEKYRVESFQALAQAKG